MIGEDRFTCSRRTRGGRTVPSNPRARNFHGMRTFSWQSKLQEQVKMGRGLLLWLIGIPIPIILLIWLFGGLHG